MTDREPGGPDRLATARAELAALDRRRAELLAEIRGLEPTSDPAPGPPATAPAVTASSPPAEKIALFRALFRGREDVYPRRWESAKSGRSGYAFACANEWRPGICRKPEIKCRDCGHREYLPVTADMIRWHLQGRDPAERRRDGSAPPFVAGVYPLQADDTTWFLAADFDKASWEDDARAYLDACRAAGVPAALERSRSGRGAHVWVFFSAPVPARAARQLGAQLLAAAMDARPEIGMDSYDRFFPSQDRMPKGGFGNLIALPLQHGPRAAGNSVFVDRDLRPYPDQWAFLSGIGRLDPAGLEDRRRATARPHDRLFAEDLEEEQAALPWETPGPAARDPAETEDLPARLAVTLADRVYVPKAGLPPGLRHRILRLATFGNPEFFRAQRMRFSTHDKPRFICCADDFPGYLGLPRGCLPGLEALLEARGVGLEITDERTAGTPVNAAFAGELRPGQAAAAAALLAHDTGVLSAPTGFGKTVIGAKLIAARGVNTLVLVHRRELLEQWRAQLASFLGRPPEAVGAIGGGKRKPTGEVDVAMIQSLRRGGEVDPAVAGYGHLVVDECHHLSAVSFEAVAKAARARYVTGLSATVRRKDGHHPIVFMQCGPLRHKVDPRAQAAARPFRHTLRVRETGFVLPETAEDPGIQEVYRQLVADRARNDLVVDDVISAVHAGRRPVILAERKDHVAFFEARLSGFVKNLFVLHGGLRPKARRETLAALRALPADAERLLVATGRYLGEGFDDPGLDTLFLVHPISWRGTLSQYVGRLHRLHPGKEEVRVYDYLDAAVPVLARMFTRRRRGYRALGYTEEEGG